MEHTSTFPRGELLITLDRKFVGLLTTQSKRIKQTARSPAKKALEEEGQGKKTQHTASKQSDHEEFRLTFTQAKYISVRLLQIHFSRYIHISVRLLPTLSNALVYIYSFVFKQTMLSPSP